MHRELQIILSTSVRLMSGLKRKDPLSTGSRLLPGSTMTSSCGRRLHQTPQAADAGGDHAEMPTLNFHHARRPWRGLGRNAWGA